MSDFSGRNILGGGGSSGIGLELIRSLAVDYALKRIRFNAIALSLTDTQLASALPSPESRSITGQMFGGAKL
jgi:NAD(P)-dependent dehydrogenase (short-subunit alcohol dehydrogenase family)